MSTTMCERTTAAATAVATAARSAARSAARVSAAGVNGLARAIGTGLGAWHCSPRARQGTALACAAALVGLAGYGTVAAMSGSPEVALRSKSTTPVAFTLPAQEAFGVIAAEAQQIEFDRHAVSLYSIGDALRFMNLTSRSAPVADPFAASAGSSQAERAQARATLAAQVAEEATGTPAPPEAQLVAAGLNAEGKVQLSVGQNTVVKTSVNVARVSIGSAEVAEVTPLMADTILVTGRKSGSTQVIVWDDQGKSQIIDVIVNTDLTALTTLIKHVLPDAQIEITEVNGAVALRGVVSDATQAKQAEELAGQYGKVINHLEVAGGQRVVVKIQFAEVSRSVSTDLGVNWGFSDGRTVIGSNVGQISPLGFASTGNSLIGGLGIPDPSSVVSLFGRGLVGSSEFAYFVEALQENNLMRMLSEPYLITNSGETSETFAGGEFAVPVPSSNGGSPTIEYREFGIRLKCTPVVLGNGTIRMKVEYEVSQLDDSAGTNVLGVRVPGLRKRSGNNTVELGEGQTLPISGLFDAQTVTNVQKFPGLGDLPLIGQLFRSTRFLRRETELVVLLTPNLAGPLNPDQVPALPGTGWRHPSTMEQAVFGDIGGDAQADERRDAHRDPASRGVGAGDPAAPGTANVNPSGVSKGYAYGSPMTNPRHRPVRTEQAPPLFIGDAGYAPIQAGKDTQDATVGAAE